MINTVAHILLAIMVITIFFGIIHLIFSLGRVYECTISIRELDEKIDKELRELEKIKNKIADLEMEQQKGGGTDA